MTEPTACDEFLDDPTAHEEHLRSCQSCRDLVLELDKIDRALLVGSIVEPSLHPLTAKTLPLAPWEGARYRSWPLIFFVLSALLGAAILLYVSAGVSPTSGFRNVVTGDLLPVDTLIGALRHVGSGLQRAPVSFHLLVAGSFVLVNILFYFLLRRAPKGVDVSIR
jgi:predicted anti-sigma-YlaC factor YlaD